MRRIACLLILLVLPACQGCMMLIEPLCRAKRVCGPHRVTAYRDGTYHEFIVDVPYAEENEGRN